MTSMRYTKEHEWVRMDGDAAVCGISEYAQGQLGDVVYVELPEVGRAVEQDEEIAVVESVKAASDVFAPLSGTIAAVNEALGDNPGLVNTDPLGDGWFFRIELGDPSEVDALMDEAAYASFVKGLG